MIKLARAQILFNSVNPSGDAGAKCAE